MKINADIEIDPHDIACSMNYDEAINLIIEIDKGFADVEFTERLITSLVKSLKNDSTHLKFIKWDKV